MQEQVWQRILNQVAAYTYTIQFYFQGEPLLNPRLPHMIAQASEKKTIYHRQYQRTSHHAPDG
jgi:hypothetical protein